jgi:bla regulator protein blaR1
MKTRHVVWVIAALALGHTSAFAQAAAPARFEVASVKPSDPNSSSTGLFGSIPSMRPQGAGGIAVSNMPLRLLVRLAYSGLQDFQIVGGPSWQMSSKFDITAKAPEGTTKGTQDLLPMMRTLLAERFKLKTHTENRDLPIYALMIARSDGKLGPDIKPSSSDCSNAAEAQKRAEELAKGGGAGLLSMLAKGETIPCMIMPAMNPSNPTGSFGLRGNGQAMTGLTQFLTQITGRMVHDKTGLMGLYDFELRFDPQVLMAMLPQLGINMPATANLPASDSPALLTALQEQLGLKLDSQKGPVEVLVIDSVEMPEPD